MAPIQTKRISWVGVNTEKYAEMVTFLRDVMGCTIKSADEILTVFQFRNGDLFEVFNAVSGARKYFNKGPVPEFLVDDVAETQRTLEAAGIKFLSEPKSGSGYAWSHFIGPDENVYGLASGNYEEPRLLFEEHQGEYFISTNKQLLQPNVIHNYLSQSYWAKNRPMWKVQRSIEHSLCFGIYFGKEQVGFCRVVSDYITIAWIADVFVLEPHRGKGLSKWLMKCVMNHPELKDMRRWVLATKDAHDLYAQSGFTGLVRPERWMEKFDEIA